MKKKNSGFTLIELVVAIAIIGILSTLVTPKVREQLAKGRDAKGIAFLNALRTASELYYIEYGKPPLEDITKGGNPADVESSLDKLKEFLDPKGESFIKNGKIQIGGVRKQVSGAGGPEAEKKVIFGGEISFTFINPDGASLNQGDGVYIWFKEETGREYDSSGRLWKDY